jgi:hypothetical protein
MVTVTVSAQTAANLAELVHHELSTSRHSSVLHLRLDDHGDQRDDLLAVAALLEA